MQPLVYVAGPITVPDPLENANRAIALSSLLMDDGVVVPFCPHLSVAHQLAAPRTWEQWLVYDEAVIQHCHALYRMDGASKGADREVAFALGGRGIGVPIPVFYEANGLDMLYWWARNWAAEQRLTVGV